MKFPPTAGSIKYQRPINKDFDTKVELVSIPIANKITKQTHVF